MSMVIWCSTRFLAEPSSSPARRASASGSPGAGGGAGHRLGPHRRRRRATPAARGWPRRSRRRSSTAPPGAHGPEPRQQGDRIAAPHRSSTSSSRASTTLVSSAVDDGAWWPPPRRASSPRPLRALRTVMTEGPGGRRRCRRGRRRDCPGARRWSSSIASRPPSGRGPPGVPRARPPPCGRRASAPNATGPAPGVVVGALGPDGSAARRPPGPTWSGHGAGSSMTQRLAHAPQATVGASRTRWLATPGGGSPAAGSPGVVRATSSWVTGPTGWR